MFEALHARGREALADGRPDEAARELRRALDMWRGVPLAEFAEPFARLEEARLAEQQLTCLEECVDAELALGREAELVAELEALVRRHPLRERPRGQLMLALYRSGRHAEALEAFQSFRRTLDDELGIDPPPRLKELQRRMLQQDRSLDLVPSGARTGPRGAARRRGSRARAATPAESRKLVTVLVADVAPTHALDDPEARRAALLERTRAAEQELARHGASVAPFGGGRVLGVFGVPTAQDDDSLRAVTAAVALRSSGLATRVGLSTGEVVTGDPLVAGAPVDEAARLQERAGAGDVLASARTWRAVRHAVEATPREEGWAVDTVDPRAPPMVRRLETPLVGRERELREITKEFESAVAAGVPRLVTVFGAPGLGKTRLAVECVERLERMANAAVTHCRADGRDATYAPLRDLLTELADGDPAAWLRRRLGTDDAPHLADQLAVAVGLADGNRTRRGRRARRRAGCSPASRGSALCSSSSRTCTGPHLRSSTSSSRSSNSPTLPSWCSAWRVPTCSTSGRTGAAGACAARRSSSTRCRRRSRRLSSTCSPRTDGSTLPRAAASSRSRKATRSSSSSCSPPRSRASSARSPTRSRCCSPRASTGSTRPIEPSSRRRPCAARRSRPRRCRRSSEGMWRRRW